MWLIPSLMMIFCGFLPLGLSLSIYHRVMRRQDCCEISRAFGLFNPVQALSYSIEFVLTPTLTPKLSI